MTPSRGLRRWGAAGCVMLLGGAASLTRTACAPAPSPGARAPFAAAAAALPDQAAGDAPKDAPFADPAPDPALEADTAARATIPPAPAPDTPFEAPKGARPIPADRSSPNTATAATSSALPAIERQEIALLASIERDLKREPPPEVHALLGKYRRGADRATLVTSVQRELPNDLPLRVTVLRWIDRVRPEPGGSSPAPAVPGQGTGKSWVRPLERR